MVQGTQFTPGGWEQIWLSGPATRRLLVACALGGLVGLERELRRKGSGLRTNMLICMGSALFTMMSAALAGAATPDKSRVAANIVQGVGFLGAGLILHSRSRILGLTTAASVFVVAAIGMACGAGLYVEASIATLLVLIALQAVGAVEGRIGWQRFPMLYEVRAEVGASLSMDAVGQSAAATLAVTAEQARHRMFTAILKVLDSESLRLEVQSHDNVAGLERILFPVVATRRAHTRLLEKLRASDATDQVLAYRDWEDE